MSMQTDKKRNQIIEKILAHAREQSTDKNFSLVAEFIQQLYSNVSLDDLIDRTPADLYGLALSLEKLMQRRKPKQTKMAVFNPSLKRYGWHSTHTIVEIVHPDMPFLVESMRMEVNRHGLSTHLTINLGGIKVLRNAQGELIKILPPNSQAKKALIEAPIYIEIDRQTDAKTLKELRFGLNRILKDVTVAVEDWQKMKLEVEQALKDIDDVKGILDPEDIEESKAFLLWLMDDHFTFLGCRNYEVVGSAENKALQIIPKSGLGVLRNTRSSKVSRDYSELPPEARKLALSKQLLIISKTNTVSTVHRPAYTDYIGVKRFNKQGELIGERRFIGLYTHDAYHSNPKYIPLLRRKVKTVLQKSKLPPYGHAAKVLLNILEVLPREDLFQGSFHELFELATGIMELQDRRCTKLFIRKDVYGRYVSCLVYVPRDNFNTEVLNRMRKILENTFNGHEASYDIQFPESILARIHFNIRINPKKRMYYDIKTIEKELTKAARSWKDDFREELLKYYGEEKGNQYFRLYNRAFPISYQEDFQARSAVFDIEHIEKLSPEHTLEMSFYRPTDGNGSNIRFKLFCLHDLIPISDALPILENMGLRVIGEQPYEVILNNQVSVWISDFIMTYAKEPNLDVEKARIIFQETFSKVWRAELENDGFNKLVLAAQLNWHEIRILRAYAKYLRQTGFTFSQPYIESAFIENPILASLLIKLFKLWLNPKKHINNSQELVSVEEVIQKELDKVVNLDEDRIFRRYQEMIYATLRSNYFQTDASGKVKPYLSLKFDSKKVPGLPLPRPMYEIFVYSARFEGIHLRAAKVARGGLRWSDRREDFRTEILGLMKAQAVKNAVIVPGGAKGGFILKQPPINGTRESILEEAIICYKDFIRGLLDLTDNIVASKVIPVKNTARHDDDDPYLVVAADKGTATFSDIANDIAKEYNFWLGDAFASGGSVGYDHKKMGITARGVWESVKRHLREWNTDPTKDNFTVVGIGDMSGDVFGNGMLLSEHTQLVAAFNHQHIFIDPNPDPEISFQERLRLFNLPRSTWDDYNKQLISKGGGVYQRSMKSIKLSSEAQRLLHSKKENVIPNELIKALLKTPVDLIWNGGIGTYVKASSEAHANVGDRANDVLRINASELRCRSIGEGGNLGLTQLARVEYELHGGLINTDFLDNSAGVDCSDHEVNIKILLNDVVSHADSTEKQRNALLAKMTDDIARLVLQNNYRQNRVITLAVSQSPAYTNLYIRYIRKLQNEGKLDRELEFLPDDKTLLERKSTDKGLTRPEAAVLLAYSKNILKEEILASDIPENPYLAHRIESAFPEILMKLYPEYIKKHSLRRELIATQMSNNLISDMGMIFLYQMQDEIGASTQAIVCAYTAARKIFNMPKLWADIESLDYIITPDTQIKLRLQVIQLIRRAARWFLRNRPRPLDIVAVIEQFSEPVKTSYKSLPKRLVGLEKEHFEKLVIELTASDVPLEIATKIATTQAMHSVLNIVEAANTYGASIKDTTKAYFTLEDCLEITWFRNHIDAYPIDDRWGLLARAAFKSDLDWQQRTLTAGILKMDIHSKSVPARINIWLQQHKDHVTRWQAMLSYLRNSNTLEFAMLSVAIRELHDLAKISLLDSSIERG